jgi:hypothetical protein
MTKNPNSNPVIILRGLFDIKFFFNFNRPSVPIANTDKTVHIDNIIKFNLNKKAKSIPITAPIYIPVQRAQTGN